MKIANGMVVAVALGLSVLAIGEKSAQANSGGIGFQQGAMCVGERPVDAANVSYFFGNGSVEAAGNGNPTWVDCPVINVGGNQVNAFSAQITVGSLGTGTGTCYLHRLDQTGGQIATSTVTVPANVNATVLSFAEPPGAGNVNYSIECLLAAGGQVLSYIVAASQ
jgi:hypothetical protein